MISKAKKKKLINKISQSKYYKTIKANLNYKDVKNYVSVENLVQQLSLYLYSFKEKSLLSIYKQDDAALLYLSAVDFIYQQFIPCYWLEKDLIKALINTDLPHHWIDLKPFVPKGILLLPKGLIISPEGFSLNWLYFEHNLVDYLRPKVEVYRNSVKFAPLEDTSLTWTTQLSNGAIYATRIGLTPDKNGLPTYADFEISDLAKQGYVDEIIIEREELNFIKLVSNLSFQFMLYMMAKPDTLIVNSELGRKGFGKSKEDPQRDPFWIGKNFQVKRENKPSSTSNPGSGGSKITHWRRGHWRNQPIGAKDNRDPQFKQIWIEPVLING